MSTRRFLALGAAIAALSLAATSAAATSSGTKVNVRVEGLARTLLSTTAVSTHSGWITKYGAPKGKCPADSAQGALDLATDHRWGGIWDGSFGEYEITSILGEKHSFTSKYYWEIFVDDVAASAGACEINLRRGEQLLFAAVPDKGTEYPIAIKAPSSVSAGHAFEATVVWFNARGKAKPLAGATLAVAGQSGKTNSHGTISLKPAHPGTFVLKAEHPGYIRAASVRLKVS